MHQETYGKTGCRRIIPGEFLAVDPKGRAFLLAAVEKQKSARLSRRDTCCSDASIWEQDTLRTT